MADTSALAARASNRRVAQDSVCQSTEKGVRGTVYCWPLFGVAGLAPDLQGSPTDINSLREFPVSGNNLRSIHDLTTEEAYDLVSRHFGHELPPLDAVENEDWGRDYVLQCFLRHTPEELASAGLTWDEEPG